MPLSPIPASLYQPPTSRVKPVTTTRLQILPFEDLSWKDFERLCLRLVLRDSDVEHAQCYGEQGDEQEGIDLFASTQAGSKYRVYQCKNESDFGPAKIREAVQTFLNGEWLTRSEQFVLCSRESFESRSRADEVRKQRDNLQAHSVRFVIWDRPALSEKLKSEPELVDDFFGRSWVAAFCGDEAATRLSTKRHLDGPDIARWRETLRAFYGSLFNRHDPGLPGDQFGMAGVNLLEERYVFPDFTTVAAASTQTDVDRPIGFGYRSAEGGVSDNDRMVGYDVSEVEGRSERGAHASRISNYTLRQTFHGWLGTSSRSVILGGPGSGKSTLLRFIVLDLLSESPRVGDLAAQWGERIPIWVPFGWWTKKLSDNSTDDCSLSQLLEAWLGSLSASHLWPAFEQALEDERLLLLVDGLDEWATEDAARQALGNLQVFLDLRTAVPAVLTSRPHGFERLQTTASGWLLGELADFTMDQCRELTYYWFKRWARTLPLSQIFAARPLAADGDNHTTAAPSSQTEKPADENEIVQWAESRTSAFIDELERSSDLRGLARTPLLLCLLIAFRTQNAHLPTGRFELYEKAVDYLIVTHPSRRREASRLSGRPFQLQNDELRSIFAHLALFIQEREPSGIIADKEAREAVIACLVSTTGRFSMNQREANQIADALLEIADDTTGLVVRKSPLHIGFFHRAFAEFLAAWELSDAGFDVQLAAVNSRCHDPQWHEVLLCLFARTTRSSEIDLFVREIQKSAGIASHNPVVSGADTAPSSQCGTCHSLSFDRDFHSFDSAALLAQIAFGPFKCPANTAKSLALETFRRIEEASWLPYRERLLRAALTGLHSTPVRSLVQERIILWFPDRRPHGAPTFNALRTWPRSPYTTVELDNASKAAFETSLWKSVRDVLWRGLNSEEVRDAKLAGETLAHLWPNDVDLRERLTERALHAISPVTRVAALYGLLEGWPNHEQTALAIDRARESLDHQLRLAGIAGMVRQKRHKDRDRKMLLRLPSDKWGVGYHFVWDSMLTDLVREGWAGCPKIKRACLYLMRPDILPQRESQPPADGNVDDGSVEAQSTAVTMSQEERDNFARHELRDKLGISHSNHYWPEALVVMLLTGYPGDDAVAAWCTDQIDLDWKQAKNAEYYQTNFLDKLHGWQWKLLLDSFGRHPLVVDATKRWLDNHPHPMHQELSRAAMYVGDAHAKAKLLELRVTDGKESRPNLDVEALLDGWGMGDSEVAQTLTKIAFGEAVAASRIARLLTRIIPDTRQCRERLLELLRSNYAIEADAIIDGFSVWQKVNSPLPKEESIEWESNTEEIINLALRRGRALRTIQDWRHDPTINLLNLYPSHERLRKVAAEEIAADGEISAVLLSFACDDLSLDALSHVGAPLSTSLRRLIASQVREGSGDEAYDLSILRHYNRDSDPQINVEMSIGFYERLKNAPDPSNLGLDRDSVFRLQQEFEADALLPTTTSYVAHLAAQRECAEARLRNEMVRGGGAIRQRGASAYAGALVFDPKIVQKVRESERVFISDYYGEPNAPFSKIILEHWDEHVALWDHPAQISRLSSTSDLDEEHFWGSLAPFAERYPVPRQFLLDRCRAKSFVYDDNVLRFLANTSPRSSLLSTRCLELMDRGLNLNAAAILATQFGGNPDILDRITRAPDGQRHKYYSDSTILALCEGWPDSAVLDEIFNAAKDSDADSSHRLRIRISTWTAAFALMSRKSESDVIRENLIRLLNRYPFPVEHSSHFDGLLVQLSLRRRMREDEILSESLWKELESSDNPTAKIVLPTLLVASPGYDSAVTAWCRAELERQLSSAATPEIGFDWLSFSLRPVAHSLLDLISRSR